MIFIALHLCAHDSCTYRIDISVNLLSVASITRLLGDMLALHSIHDDL